MKRWFVENTGYVLQLATPFYEELTVRENLLFAINMQLPKSANWNQKLERVEQVIREVSQYFFAIHCKYVMSTYNKDWTVSSC